MPKRVHWVLASLGEIHPRHLPGQSWEAGITSKRRFGNTNVPRVAKQPEDINVGNWISADIYIGVDATTEPQRITLWVTADCRVVVPESILVEARLAIEDLAWETQVVGELRC